jgi:hypothetical protein
MDATKSERQKRKLEKCQDSFGLFQSVRGCLQGSTYPEDGGVFLNSEVYMVYRHILGDCEGIFVYAVCSTKNKAKAARMKAAGFRKRWVFYNVDPDCSPYAFQLRILKLRIDRLYSLGVFSRKSEEIIK